jgi:hypothetical protein
MYMIARTQCSSQLTPPIGYLIPKQFSATRCVYNSMRSN